MATRLRARSPGRTLRRQVSREVHAITALAMLGLLLPILLFDLTTLVDLLANRGLPASLVAGLVGLRVVPALAIAVAPAVLLAVIATLARMRAHQELLALEGSGVALVRLGRPILTAALLWSLIAAALTLEGAPATHRRAQESPTREHFHPFRSYARIS